MLKMKIDIEKTFGKKLKNEVVDQILDQFQKMFDYLDSNFSEIKAELASIHTEKNENTSLKM